LLDIVDTSNGFAPAAPRDLEIHPEANRKPRRTARRMWLSLPVDHDAGATLLRHSRPYTTASSQSGAITDC